MSEAKPCVVPSPVIPVPVPSTSKRACYAPRKRRSFKKVHGRKTCPCGRRATSRAKAHLSRGRHQARRKIRCDAKKRITYVCRDKCGRFVKKAKCTKKRQTAMKIRVGKGSHRKLCRRSRK